MEARARLFQRLGVSGELEGAGLLLSLTGGLAMEARLLQRLGAGELDFR